MNRLTCIRNLPILYWIVVTSMKLSANRVCIHYLHNVLHPLKSCFNHNMQAVYNYTYPSSVPSDIILACTAENISLLNAEQCLYYRYGQLGWVKYIWAIGLLAAGQSSTMTVCVCVFVYLKEKKSGENGLRPLTIRLTD